MDPIEVVVTLFLDVMLGMLIGKIVSDIYHDKLAFRNRGVICIVRCYFTENPIRGILSLVITAFLVFQWHSRGTASASVAIRILAFVAPLSSCFFQKGYSDVEIYREIEHDKCNIGRSLAINFEINYLDRILIDLPKKLESFQLGVDDKLLDTNSGQMENDATPFTKQDYQGSLKVLKKLFILIPKSGNINYDTLSKADSSISSVGTILIKSINISGHKDRKFIITIYELKQKDWQTDWQENVLNCYFAAEFATPLTSLFGIKNLPNKSGKRTTPDQVELFYNSLVELLHRNKKKYGDLCCPVFYDDTCDENPLSKVLYKELIKEYFMHHPQTSSHTLF